MIYVSSCPDHAWTPGLLCQRRHLYSSHIHIAGDEVAANKLPYFFKFYPFSASHLTLVSSPCSCVVVDLLVRGVDGPGSAEDRTEETWGVPLENCTEGHS